MGNESTDSKRNFGLDIIRCLAILGVVLSHFDWFLVGPEHRTFSSAPANLGIEAFFVLSGFLVGGILCRNLAGGQLEGVKDLLRFWKNRWLRTLPLYFVFLLVFASKDLSAYGLLKYLTFTFSIFEFDNSSVYRGILWTLAIEEVFYFFFPIILLVAFKIWSSAKMAVRNTIGLYLITGLVFRFLHVPATSWEDFNHIVKMSVICRLDAMVVGVALSYIYHFRAEWWPWLNKLAPIATANLVLAGFVAYNIPFWVFAPGESQTLRAITQLFYSNYISLSIGLILPYLSISRFIGIGQHARWLIQRIAVVSYSMYLLHLPTQTGVMWTLNFLNSWAPHLQPYEYPNVLRFFHLILVFLASNLTYLFIEKPWMELRPYLRLSRKEKSFDPAI